MRSVAVFLILVMICEQLFFFNFDVIKRTANEKQHKAFVFSNHQFVDSTNK